MYPRIVLSGLVCVLASTPFIAFAQPGMRPAPQSFGMAEAYSEIQVLKSQIAQLQQQAAQQKADYENQLTAARFRITALEAAEKQGGSAVQLQKAIDVLSFRVTALEGYQKQGVQSLASLTSRLDALTSKFQSHTHTYKMTSFGFANHELLPPVHIGEEGLPRPTSPPN